MVIDLFDLATLLTSRPSLLAQISVLSTTLASLVTQVQAQTPLFDRFVAYPLPTFPGREQEGLLNQLLRKKLEPNVEEWIEQGTEAVGRTQTINLQGWQDLWGKAGLLANEEARKHAWGIESDESSEDEDDMQGIEPSVTQSSKPMAMVDVLRFLTTGERTPAA